MPNVSDLINGTTAISTINFNNPPREQGGIVRLIKKLGDHEGLRSDDSILGRVLFYHIGRLQLLVSKVWPTEPPLNTPEEIEWWRR